MSSLNKRNLRLTSAFLVFLTVCLTSSTGCRSLLHWSQNGFRVGPNYGEPDAPIAEEFSETESPVIDASSIVDTEWWRVFDDPDLEFLIDQLLEENLTLKAALWRINEARAIRNIAAGNLFPQFQVLNGQFFHNQASPNSDGFFPFAPITTRDWSTAFDAGWELDLWGRIRRSVASADAQLESTVKDYDYAVVTLIAEVASLYITIVSLDERLKYADENVTLLKGSLDIADKRFKAGRTSRLDVEQAKSNLAIVQATVPQLELSQRQALNALAVLLAIPPSEISSMFKGGKELPTIPESVIVGIPAELLMRRPDIRAAERQLAAQFEQIGIAEAEFYPTFSVNGSLGYQAAQLSDLFQSSSYTGLISPGFEWNILNYGRLLNGVEVEESRVNQLCFEFKNKVLLAQQEVEDGIISFIKNKERYNFDEDNRDANLESVKLSMLEYKEGRTNFGRVYVVQSIYVQSQDQLVATKANIALGLIEVYKALGGGWETRLNETGPNEFAPIVEPEPEPEPDPEPETDDLTELRNRIYRGSARSLNLNQTGSTRISRVVPKNERARNR